MDMDIETNIVDNNFTTLPNEDGKSESNLPVVLVNKEVQFCNFFCIGDGLDVSLLDTIKSQTNFMANTGSIRLDSIKKFKRGGYESVVFNKDNSLRNEKLDPTVPVNLGYPGSSIFIRHIFDNEETDVKSDLFKKIKSKPSLLGFFKDKQSDKTQLCILFIDNSLHMNSNIISNLIAPCFKFSLDVIHHTNAKLVISNGKKRASIQALEFVAVKSKKSINSKDNIQKEESAIKANSEIIVDPTESIRIISEWLVFSPYVIMLKEFRAKGASGALEVFVKAIIGVVIRSHTFINTFQKKGIFTFSDILPYVMDYNLVEKAKVEVQHYMTYSVSGSHQKNIMYDNIKNYLENIFERLREAKSQFFRLYDARFVSLYGSGPAAKDNKRDSSINSQSEVVTWSNDTNEKTKRKEEEDIFFHKLEQDLNLESSKLIISKTKGIILRKVVDISMIDIDYVGILLSKINEWQRTYGCHLLMVIANEENLIKDVLRPSSYFKTMNYIREIEDEYDKLIFNEDNQKDNDLKTAKDNCYRGPINVYSSKCGANAWNWVTRITPVVGTQTAASIYDLIHQSLKLNNFERLPFISFPNYVKSNNGSISYDMYDWMIRIPFIYKLFNEFLSNDTVYTIKKFGDNDRLIATDDTVTKKFKRIHKLYKHCVNILELIIAGIVSAKYYSQYHRNITTGGTLFFRISDTHERFMTDSKMFDRFIQASKYTKDVYNMIKGMLVVCHTRIITHFSTTTLKTLKHFFTTLTKNSSENFAFLEFLKVFTSSHIMSLRTTNTELGVKLALGCKFPALYTKFCLSKEGLDDTPTYPTTSTTTSTTCSTFTTTTTSHTKLKLLEILSKNSEIEKKFNDVMNNPKTLKECFEIYTKPHSTSISGNNNTPGNKNHRPLISLNESIECTIPDYCIVSNTTKICVDVVSDCLIDVFSDLKQNTHDTSKNLKPDISVFKNWEHRIKCSYQYLYGPLKFKINESVDECTEFKKMICDGEGISLVFTTLYGDRNKAFEDLLCKYGMKNTNNTRKFHVFAIESLMNIKNIPLTTFADKYSTILLDGMHCWNITEIIHIFGIMQHYSLIKKSVKFYGDKFTLYMMSNCNTVKSFGYELIRDVARFSIGLQDLILKGNPNVKEKRLEIKKLSKTDERADVASRKEQWNFNCNNFLFIDNVKVDPNSEQNLSNSSNSSSSIKKPKVVLSGSSTTNNISVDIIDKKVDETSILGKSQSEQFNKLLRSFQGKCVCVIFGNSTVFS